MYMGREIAAMMGAAGGSWLERDSRQREEEVSQAVARLPRQPDDVVADIGAGSGRYTRPLARAVAPGGVVYAIDIDTAVLERNAHAAETGGLSQRNSEQGV